MSDNKNEKILKSDFWSKLWELLTPSHKQIKILLGFIMFFEASRLIGPYILKLIIDIITNFSQEYIGELAILTLAMFGVNQFVAVIDYFIDKRIIAILADSEKYLPINAYKKLLALHLGYHEQENTGNKVSKIIRGVDKISNFLGNLFWDVTPTIFQIIFTTIVLVFVDWRFAAIFILLVPIFVFLTLKGNTEVHPFRQQRQSDYEKSTGMITQSIININTVKSFVQEKREEAEHDSVMDRMRKNITKEFNLMLKYNWSRNLVIDLGRVFVLFLGVYFVWQDLITVGSLVFVITISEKALLSLFRISRLYDRIMEGSESITRLHTLEKEEIKIVNPEDGVIAKSITGKIEFKNVYFSYDGDKQSTLEKVSLKIQPGTVTALVGPSGSGKTTVARMIYRHYDPKKGAVMLDGINLKDYDLYSFRKFISIVPQEVEIFSSSIEDNIAYGCRDASKKEIIAAAKIANADEFIEKLPQKYKTEVGERGIKLSGGQRQRIGIARAILVNPRILIFDEATSSLDSYNEKLIQEAIQKVSRDRTVIIIAHRLSTIKKADKIIVFENGKVVEEGNHYELMQKKGGLYAKLIGLQKIGEIS